MKKTLLVLFVGLLSLLNSCSNKPDAPLRVGLFVWPPYEYFILAEENGYYDNSKIRLVDYRTISEALRAYKNDYIDAIAVTNQIFFNFYEQNEI